MQAKSARLGTRVASLLAALLVITLSGCRGGEGRIRAPDFHPSSSAEKAITQLDRSKDGFIDADEAVNSPGLNAVFAVLDNDSDSKISATEIESALAALEQSKVGMIGWTLRLFLDERPLSDADVTLTPVSFLEGVIKPASGTTNRQGIVTLSVAEEFQPGPNIRALQCGFYDMAVSLVKDGEETIPEKYNTQTTLGVFVDPASRNDRVDVFLDSK